MEERENPGMRARFASLFEKKWFTALLLLAGALGVGLLTLCFSVTANRSLMLQSYLKRPLLMLLNLLPFGCCSRDHLSESVLILA